MSYLQSLYIIISILYIEKESEELYYNFCILDLINIILRMFTIYPMTTGAHSQHIYIYIYIDINFLISKKQERLTIIHIIHHWGTQQTSICRLFLENIKLYIFIIYDITY